MSKIIDWKKYFTQTEVDKKIHDSIRKNAKDVAKEVINRWKLETKEINHV